jgi:capsular polysaccharide biosynthesis protein
MELRDYYKILKSNISLIATTALIFILIVYAWSVRESQKYSAQFLLNIGRLNTQNSADFHYDQFYQVQADEKFSQTIEEWLKFPGISGEIFDRAGINKDGATLGQLTKSISAERISPESVLVRYGTDNEDEAKKIADAVGKVIDERTSNLNSQAKDPYWFKVSTSDLIVAKNKQDLIINLGAAFIAGIIIGSFLALLKHYLSEENK